MVTTGTRPVLPAAGTVTAAAAARTWLGLAVRGDINLAWRAMDQTFRLHTVQAMLWRQHDRWPDGFDRDRVAEQLAARPTPGFLRAVQALMRRSWPPDLLDDVVAARRTVPIAPGLEKATLIRVDGLEAQDVLREYQMQQRRGGRA